MYDPSMFNWNTNNGNGFLNTYSRPMLPHYEIVKVNGEAGARAFQMAPNSNLFLADATNPQLIWLVQTDGAGYLSATPLDVCLHQEKPQPDISSLENRIKHLEEAYEQFNSGLNKQPKKQRTNSATEQSTNATT